MSRPAHARKAILAAAETIVKQIGAANLTYDALVRESGITRGGITYHFPTKDKLLRALVEHDMARWKSVVETHRTGDTPLDSLRAYIAGNALHDDDSTRLCAGLLSAASGAKELNEPWRDYFAELRAKLEQGPDPQLALILMLAMDGMFWLEAMGLARFEGPERTALHARMTALVHGMEPVS